MLQLFCRFLQRSSTLFVQRTSMSSANNRLVWIDCEMTGLDVNVDHLLEVACIITEENLEVVNEEGVNLVIHQPDVVLDAMGPWCKEHHGKSGLTEKVKASKISVADAERTLLDYVKSLTIKGTALLAGNTIHMDKRFLDKYMPALTEHLHYRLLDVSTVKELCRRWYPEVYSRMPAKMGSHRALDDILESIAELKYYKENIFK